MSKKKYAYDLEPGDEITSLVLDPEGHVIVDYVTLDEENQIVRVEGYVKDDGTEFSFTWGFDKSVAVA